MVIGFILIAIGAAVIVAAAILLKKYLNTRYDISVDEFDRKFRHERLIASEELTTDDKYEEIAEKYGITPEQLDAEIRQKSTQFNDEIAADGLNAASLQDDEQTEKL
jgi:hypothetical protein